MIEHFLDHISEVELELESLDIIENFISLLALSGSLTDPNEFQLTLEQHHLAETIPDNPPYTLPVNWKWSMVGAVCQHQAGKALNSKNNLGDLESYLCTANVQDGFFDLETIKQMYFKDHNEFLKYSIEYDDVLVLEGGSVGRTAIWDGESNVYAIQNHLHRLRPIVNLATPRYIDLVLKTAYRLGHSSALGKGIGIQGLSAGKLKLLSFPLAPFEEQNCIVERVDEFMSIIKQMKSLKKTNDLTLSDIQKSAFSELSMTQDNASFEMGFSLIADNAEIILSKASDLNYLRRMILHLAVRGKLVPQNDKDEPVSELLNRIASKKGKEIEDGIITQPKSFTDIERIGEPFEIPTGWKWTQLGRECLVIMGNSPKSASYNTEGVGVPLINGPVEFSKDSLGPTLLTKYTSEPTKLCKAGDILVCVRGATTGRTNIAAFDACIGRGVGLVRGYDAQDYVNLYMLWVGRELLATGKGMIFPSITYDDLASKPIPMPPLNEGIHIINKVRELYSMCDLLEVGLLSEQKLRPNLMNSLIEEILEAL